MSLMHFHSNVSYCCVTMSCGISIVTKQCEQRRCYGNGSVLDVRESFRDSCVLGSDEKGRSGVIVVINSCVRRLIEFGRVL
jgi:hypothetical protein